jgi:uncharacterized repeat protein (TIGR01451 family)
MRPTRVLVGVILIWTGLAGPAAVARAQQDRAPAVPLNAPPPPVPAPAGEAADGPTLAPDAPPAAAPQLPPPAPPPAPAAPSRLPPAPALPAPGPLPDSAAPAPTPAAPATQAPAPAAAPAPQAPAPEAEATPEGPTGPQEPAVSIEWLGPTSVSLNRPVVCQVLLKNSSPGAVHHVTAHVRLPAGATLLSSEPRASGDGNQPTWDLGTMAAGQQKRIDLQLVPAVKGDLACQASVTFTGSSTLRMQVREPKLALKATGPRQAVLGDPVTLSLVVSNPGDGSAEHVKLWATLPDGLQHPSGKSIEVEVGSLAAKESKTVPLVCLARAAGPQHCTIAAADGGSLTVQDAADVEVVQPRLDVSLTGPTLRYLNRPATYVLKVSNPGNAPASEVILSEVIPAGFQFQSASAGGQHDAGTQTVSWVVGDLAPGQSQEVNLELVATAEGEQRHRAAATAAKSLSAKDEVVTRVEGLSALLMELVDLDDPLEVGAETAYEIRVTNTGSKPETNLELVCTLPDKMEFRGARSAAGCKFRVEGKDVIFDPLPRLAPRADALYRVNVRGLAPGDLRFRARIKADGLSGPVLREESTHVYSDSAAGH